MRPIDADFLKWRFQNVQCGGTMKSIEDAIRKMVVGVIDDVPTLKEERVNEHRGEWIYDPDPIRIIGLSDMFVWKCSDCGKHAIITTDFCPNCGAKMKTVTDCHTLEDANDEQ